MAFCQSELGLKLVRGDLNLCRDQIQHALLQRLTFLNLAGNRQPEQHFAALRLSGQLGCAPAFLLPDRFDPLKSGSAAVGRFDQMKHLIENRVGRQSPAVQLTAVDDLNLLRIGADFNLRMILIVGMRQRVD